VNPVKHCVTYVTRGRFNLLSTERQDQVVLCITLHDVTQYRASEIFDTDQEIEASLDVLDPQAVFETIEERLDSYLYAGNLTERKAKLDAMRPLLPWARVVALQSHLTMLKKQVDAYTTLLQSALGEVEHLTETTA
jgi:hypothetical protein